MSSLNETFINIQPLGRDFLSHFFSLVQRNSGEALKVNSGLQFARGQLGSCTDWKSSDGVFEILDNRANG